MGLAARQALGRSSWFGIAYEKNQLSEFQGIKFPWKPTLRACFQFFGVHVLTWIAGSHGNPVFNFLRNCHPVSHSGCSILHPCQGCIHVPTSPRHCQHVIVCSLIAGVLMGVMEKAMATHSSVLAWRIPRTGEPGGLPSMGLHRVGHY